MLRLVAKVEELAPHSRCQYHGRGSLVKDEHSGILVLSEAGGNDVELNAFPCAGGSHDQSMANIPYMERKPEGSIPCRLGIDEGRPLQMLVPWLPCPNVRNGHHVDKIGAGSHGTANEMPHVPRQAPHPCVNGVEVFHLSAEAQIDESLLHQLRLGGHRLHVLVHDHDDRGIIAVTGNIRLHGGNGILCLVELHQGVLVQVFRGLPVEEQFLQHDGERLGLAVPALLDASQLLDGILFRQAVEPGHPTVGKIQLIEPVEHAEHRSSQIADRGNHTGVFPSQPRLHAAVQGCVAQVMVEKQGMCWHD